MASVPRLYNYLVGLDSFFFRSAQCTRHKAQGIMDVGTCVYTSIHIYIHDIYKMMLMMLMIGRI